MAKGFLLIKDVLRKPHLNIREIKKQTYIDDEEILINKIGKFLKYNIRDLYNCNLGSTKDQVTKILDLLYKFSYDLDNNKIIKNIIIQAKIMNLNKLEENERLEKSVNVINKLLDDFLIKLEQQTSYNNFPFNKYLSRDDNYDYHKIITKPINTTSKEDSIIEELNTVEQAYNKYLSNDDNYDYHKIIYKPINELNRKNIIIIDHPNTKSAEQAYLLKKDGSDFLFYIYIVDVTYNSFFKKNINKKIKALNQNPINKVFRFTFRIDKQGNFKDYQIHRSLISKPIHIYTPNLVKLEQENSRLYFDYQDLIANFNNKDIISLASNLVNNLVGHIALYNNWHVIYSNYKNYSLTCLDEYSPYASLSAPIRRAYDRFNEQMLSHYMDNTLTDKLWKEYYDYLSKQPKILVYKK